MARRLMSYFKNTLIALCVFGFGVAVGTRTTHNINKATDMNVLRQGILKRIHVNQHNIKANAKKEEKLPVLTVKTSSANIKGDRVEILGPSSVVYRPNKPLSCGAKVWIETTAEVRVHENTTN